MGVVLMWERIHMKAGETTEEISSDGIEKRVKRSKSHRSTPCVTSPPIHWRSMNTVRQLCVLVLGLFFCGAVYGATFPAKARYPLKISSTNPHMLVDQDNAPFLMVGDSPHSLLANLTASEAKFYMADRAARGFNTVWIDLLSVGYTGGRPDSSLLNGTKPFTNTIPGTSSYDLTTPNEAYFAYVDEVIRMAAANGIVVMLDPLDTGGMLQTALDNGSTRCRAYGRYLGNRYKNFPNLIWGSGNDYQSWSVAANDAVITSAALGIKEVDPNHLQTIELNYQASSSLDDPNWAPIVGLNLAYTYYATYAEVLHAYNQSPCIPVFMGEANFEFETDNDEDGGSPRILRMQEYWTMLSGAVGQLYGNHYIWTFLPGWQEFLDSPGVVQFGYMENLFGARKWYNLAPDQTHAFVTAGYGTFITTGPPAKESPSGRFRGNDYVTAALTADGALGMAYLPQGGTITVDMNKLRKGPITARWFDPTANTFTPIAGSPFANDPAPVVPAQPSGAATTNARDSTLPGTRQFTSPGKNSAGDPDWVFVLEAAAGPVTSQPQPVTSQTKVESGQAIRQTQKELGQLEAAIEGYHAAYGFYPPGNRANPLANQLYYELVGTSFTNDVYETLDGNTSASIPSDAAFNLFGVGSLTNCNKGGPREGSKPARNFIPELSPHQAGIETSNGVKFTVLVGSVGGPDLTYQPLGVPGLNPWRYVAPGVHNPAAYDLWIQLSISGKKCLISNWSKTVLTDSPLP